MFELFLLIFVFAGRASNPIPSFNISISLRLPGSTSDSKHSFLASANAPSSLVISKKPKYQVYQSRPDSPKPGQGDAD